MLSYNKCSVFNSGADLLCNTVNCEGVMGAGIALEFSLRYKEMFEMYKKQCSNKELKVGNVYFYDLKNVKILNFPTKMYWRHPSKIEWIEQGLISFVNNYKNFNIKSVAFPPLGCGKGGLDFQKQVRPLLEKYLSNLSIDVYICLDVNEAEGKELEMLNAFKNTDFNNFPVKLTSKQINNIITERKYIKRFFEVAKITGIGITTYVKLFDYFYNLKKPSNEFNLFTI